MSRVELILLLALAGLLYPICWNFFAVYGILVFIVLMAHEVYQYGEAAYAQLVGAWTMQKRLKSYGRWAVVTGCTRGIGLEFVRQLAEIGMDIVLVARNQRLLNELALELQSKYNVDVVQIIADFSRCDEALYDGIKEELGRLEGGIGILVNNVGVFFEVPRYFHEVPEKDIIDSVNVNVTAALRLSHHVIKEHMLPRKNGLVVLIGSAASLQTNPLFNAYAASKAYIEHLARDLHEEYKNTGIYVQGILPCFVATDMASYTVPKPTFFSPLAKTYVKWALATFGMTPITAAYMPHVFQAFLAFGTPHWLYLWCFRPKIEKIRKTHLEKLEREKSALVTNK